MCKTLPNPTLLFSDRIEWIFIPKETLMHCKGQPSPFGPGLWGVQFASCASPCQRRSGASAKSASKILCNSWTICMMMMIPWGCNVFENMNHVLCVLWYYIIYIYLNISNHGSVKQTGLFQHYFPHDSGRQFHLFVTWVGWISVSGVGKMSQPMNVVTWTHKVQVDVVLLVGLGGGNSSMFLIFTPT